MTDTDKLSRAALAGGHASEGRRTIRHARTEHSMRMRLPPRKLAALQLGACLGLAQLLLFCRATPNPPENRLPSSGVMEEAPPPSPYPGSRVDSKDLGDGSTNYYKKAARADNTIGFESI